MTDQAPPPPPPSSPYGQAPQPLSPSDERLWSTLIHIGGIFFSFVPALIGYLVLKDRSAFARAHTAAALNFQISMAIYGVACWILGTILLLVLIGIVFYIALAVIGVLVLVFSILAAVAANKGEYYSYPLSIKFVK